MAKWSIVFLAVVGCAFAEPPVSSYYSSPASSYQGGGYSYAGGHGSSLSSGGHYSSVPVGYQTNEGYNVDPHLLEKIKHIILKDEIHNQAYQSQYASSGHGLSSHYGAPAPVYGVPHDRVVGIELEHIQQGIQVAQYHQAEEGYSGGYSYGGSGYASGGYPSSGYASSGISGGHGAISYAVPSSYNTIGAPSGTYGVPHRK